MFETSQDILNLAKTGGVIILSLMTAWLIYYIAQIIRQGYKMIKEMRERINRVDDVITKLKDKIEHSTSYLILISEGVKKLVDVYKKKTSDKPKAKPKAKKTKKK